MDSALDFSGPKSHDYDPRLLATSLPSTRLGLHFTQEELNIWRSRTVNGPYLDDWNRIINRANNFISNPGGVWTGQTLNSCWLGEPSPGRSRDEALRDAGFAYLLTGDTRYLAAVRTKLLAQAAVGGTDFSNSTTWCATSEMNNVIDLGPWLRRLAYAYDYTKTGLSATDRATIEAWFQKAARYLNTKLDLRVKRCFPNYQVEDWANICWPSDINLTHYNGHMTQNGMGVFSNQEGAGMSAVAVLGILLNDSVLKASAVRFVKGWLRIAVFSDGTVFDQVRWIQFLSPPYDPGLGYAYASATIGSFVSAADHLQRAGEAIYEFSTSEGSGNSIGGPKSVGLVVQRLAEMQQHLVPVYASVDGTLSECERIDDALDPNVCPGYSTRHAGIMDVAPMAMTNIFYNVSVVRQSYSRTPPSNPTSGGYDPFGGDWGNYPGARFMFGQMEGKVWPYPSAAVPAPAPAPEPIPEADTVAPDIAITSPANGAIVARKSQVAL